MDQTERVFYGGYWIKTYPLPADTLQAKRALIDALTRRLFNHTEHGLNVPGARLKEARAAFDAETDPAMRRVKGGMLAGALFNRATDIFRRLVELQGEGVEMNEESPLVRDCGRCLLEAMELGRSVLHRSGEEGLDELWGEPFKAFSVPIEDFYESRYIKIGQCMRDIDRIAEAMVEGFSSIPVFAHIEPLVRAFTAAARTKTETLRTDAAIFDVWPRFVTTGERLAEIQPLVPTDWTLHAQDCPSVRHSEADGLELIRRGRDLIFYIARARTPMPKSTREYIERCEFYRRNGHRPSMPSPLPA
ncbi:MAG: hypothetical protein L6Q75_08770 [Burkholderiaceae bacterium]|nr:hypothetical protein [Burkholderiaceae bacterium]